MSPVFSHKRNTRRTKNQALCSTQRRRFFPVVERLEDRTLLSVASDQFVAQAYRDLLQRDADAGGLAYWSGLIDGGMPRFAVVSALENSPECQGQRIEALYTSLLHRPGDASGLAYWSRLAAAGSTMEQVRTAFLSSDEYFQSRGGGLNSSFLAAVYNDVLLRGVDPGGATGWGAILGPDAAPAPPSTRGAVAFAIVTSGEGRQDLVGGYYANYLHRPADAAGLTAWVNALGAGVLDEQVIAGIVASAEYFQNAQSSSSNVVLDWNKIALQAIQQDGSAPTVASRALAMTQAAVYDAVNAVEGAPGYYVSQTAPAGASPVAAVAAAAQRMLSYLYPAQTATFDTALSASLAKVPDGQAKTDGVNVGRSTADAIIALRAHDGFDAYVTYDGGTAPGQWQPTAPMFMAALDPQWATLEPFVMTSPSQFRPAGPPALDSQAWADALNEVKTYGSATSTARTADQTQIARFWADNVGTVTPPGHWNQIAEQAAQAQGLDLAEQARLFAELDLTMGDAAIVAWDAKYTYGAWRPIAAIQAADTAGNPNVQADATWTPLLVTPNFPEYVSGHSTFSAAAAAVLSAYFGDNYHFTTGSPGLANVTRSFASFAAAAAEAGQSRIYAGIHFQFSNQEGQAAGRALADYVLGTFATSTDTTPPRIFLDNVLPNGTTATNVTMTGRVNDNLSGVTKLEVRVDQGAYAPLPFDAATGKFSFATTFALDGSADGAHTLEFRATDAANNASNPVAFPLILGSKAPTLTITSPAPGGDLAGGANLTGSVATSGPALVSLSTSFDQGGSVPVPFTLDDGVFVFQAALDLSKLSAGAHKLTVTAQDAAGNVGQQTLDLTLSAALPLIVMSLTPAAGAEDVGVTFRPKVMFSRPIDPATLTSANFFATDPSGAKVPAAIVPADDGTFAWLFFTNPLPGASTIKLTIDGSTIKAADGSLLDADSTNMPGSKLTSTFTTVNLTAVSGTSLSGVVADPGPDLKPMTYDDVRPGPDGVLNTADDVYLQPLAGVKVWILGLDSQAVLTDAQGRFHFDSVPVGDVKLGLDGRTATNAPAGVYFPEMVMDLTIKLGQANTVMGSMGSAEEQAALAAVPGVYLPRLQTSLLHTVDAATGMSIGVDAVSAPNLTPQQRQMLSMNIPAGSMIGPDGKKLTSAQIGVSTVPPQLVRDMLPPGLLEHTFDITVQALGVATFSTPVPMTFPNLFGAAPGTQLNFLSFDHTTGRLEIDGSGTVSADGKSVSTDPGTGITHPGWHGVAPAGGPTCQAPPPPDHQAQNHVAPDVKIGEVGSFHNLEDHLFVKDFQDEAHMMPEGFKIEFRNDAKSNPTCAKSNDSPAQVFVSIEGPAQKFLQVSNPESGEIITDPFQYSLLLRPGDKKELQVDMLQLLTPEKVHAATEDILYGAKFTIEVIDAYTGAVLQQPESHYVYRLFDIADDKHEDGLLDFPRTLADGPGNFYQELPLHLDMPASAIPSANPTDGQFQYINDGTPNVKVRFDPDVGAGGGVVGTLGLVTGDLGLTTPNGQPLTVHLQGRAVGPQQVFFPEAFFERTIAQLVDAHISDPHNSSLVRLLPPDSNGDGRLSDEAGFHAAVQGLYQQIVTAVLNTYDRAVPNAHTALTILDSGSGQGDDIQSTLSTVMPDCGSTAASCAPWVDFARNTFNNLISEEDKTSLLEREFRFSEMTNQSSDDFARSGLNGVIFLVDQLAITGSLPTGSFVNAATSAIAHELGHDLGLIHFRSASQEYVSGVANSQDVMGPANPYSAGNFGGVFHAVIKFALGIPVTDQEFKFAYSYYKDLVNLETYAFNVADSPDDAVLPAPWLRVLAGPVVTGTLLPDERNSVDFGQVLTPGPSSSPGKITLYLLNDGGKDLDITNLALVGANAGFSVSGMHTLPITLPALDPQNPQPSLSEQAISIQFQPSQPGTASDILRITSNSLNGQTLDIPLTGLGVSPFGQIAVDVPNNNAGGAPVNGVPNAVNQFATLRNAGSQPLTIGGVSADDASIGQFAPTGLPTLPVTLQPGDSFVFGLAFSPKLVGLERGQLRISSDDPNKPTFTIPVVGTGLAASGSALDYGHDFVALDEPSNPAAPVLRQVSDGQGNWSFFLPPQTPIHYVIFDPVSGLVAHGFDVTSDSGQTAILSPPVFQASTAPDTSGDGLPDDVKFAIGISSTSTDPTDFARVQEGGGPLPTGLVASLTLNGAPKQIVVAGDTAYVATHSGLALVDVSQVTRPRVLAQLAVPGATDVAVEPNLKLAALPAAAGLVLVDVSDALAPVVRRTLNAAAAGPVVVFDGLAYTGGPDGVHVNDIVTGDLLEVVSLPPVGGLAREGTELYAVGSGHVAVLDIAQPGAARVLGQLTDPSLSSSGHLEVNNGVLYLAGGGMNQGFATIDVSDPAHPAVLGRPLPPPTFDAFGGIALDGAGVAVVGNVFANNGGFSVFDVTNPSNTNAFLFQIITETNNRPFAMAVSGGFAFAAAQTTGGATSTIFDVVNIESGGDPRHPSTVTLTTSAADQDPNTPGLQVAEGAAIPIQAAIVSDRPVRQAELLLNGQVVQAASAVPFDSFVAEPTIAADGPTVTFRVRVTDTAGFSFISDPFVVGLLPVTVPPAVVAINPSDGARVAAGQQAVRIAFSQALAPATVTGQTIQLLGPGGQPVPLVNLQLRGQGMAVQLAYDPLPPGTYQLVIHAPAVTNLAGTALGTADVVSHFTVLRNVQGPLFPDPVFHLPARLTNPAYLITADLRGNGRADLVEFHNDTGTVSALLSNGDGSFQAPIDLALNLPAGSSVLTLKAADLNGDGKSDVVILWSPGLGQPDSAGVLLGNGDGTFASRTDYPLNVAASDLILGDVTGDGRPDLVAEEDVDITPHQRGAHFVVRPGNADGTFAAPVESTLDGELGNTPVLAPADVNGDGRADVVAVSFTSSERTVAVLLSNGDGTFGRRQDSPLPTGVTAVSPTLANVPGHVQLAALLVSTDTTPVYTASLLSLNPDGTLGVRQDTVLGPLDVGDQVPVVADLNGDGRVDLVITHGSQVPIRLLVLLQNPDGTFTQGDDFELNGGEAVQALADLNADGRPDAILLYGTSLGYALLNDGHGHFLHQTNYQAGPPKFTLGSPFSATPASPWPWATSMATAFSIS
jgi:hypothetical protein